MRWSFFVASGLVVGSLLPLMGAPIPATLAGIGIAAAWNAWKRRGANAYEKN